jgi:hypothetical protein
MSEIRANTVTDAAGTGSPSFPNGLSVASAALTGVPTAPTAAVATNTTQIATTAFVLANVPAAGGMTLLGTIATTSGTTVTLSGLTLTSYKELKVWINAVSLATSNASALFLNSLAITPSLSSLASGWFGVGWLNLATGNGVFTTNTGLNAAGSATSFGSVHGLTTASTSISFQTAAGTFDAGSITIYGVK